MMNRTFALILIFLSFGVPGCDRLHSRATSGSRQTPSLDQSPRIPPAYCPLTRPPAIPFTASGERAFGANDDQFWLGTDKLWIPLPKSGEQWGWLPRTPDHTTPKITAKIFWGSDDFDYRKKADYSLKVTGRRLDGDAPPLEVNKVTNALFEPHAAMLTGVYVPK